MEQWREGGWEGGRLREENREVSLNPVHTEAQLVEN